MNQRNYHEKILLSCSIACSLGFLIFSIHLLHNREYLLVALDWILAGIIGGISVYAWRSRNTEFPAVALTIICLSSVVSVTHAYGPKMIFLLYPATILGFSLIDVRLSATFNAVALLLVSPSLSPELPPSEILIFYGSIIALSFFGFIFSTHTAKHREELIEIAISDPLTGAWNRRALDGSLMQCLTDMNQFKTSPTTSLLMLDLDHFKRVNDTFGHLAGDRVLREVALLIQANTGSHEHLYRYGGEEFVIVSNNTNLAQAQQLGEKIRRLIEEKHFSEVGHLTVSIGISELRHSHTPKHMLDEADKALYQAKRLGRNRVYCQITGNQS